MSHRDLCVGGSWRPARDGRTVDVLDPATGEVVGTSAVAGKEDIAAAVAAAVEGQRDWARIHPDERAKILRDAAELIDADVDEIADTLTREQGKPVPDSVKEIRFGAEVLRYYAEEGRRVSGSMRPSVRSDVRSVVGYAPVGVVAAIVPWNYPVDLYCWKVAPALAAGCAVVGKPPHDSPLAIAMIVERLLAAGVTPGALSDLPGDATAGEALVAHPDVRLITVTAATSTGKAIMRRAADDLKLVSLELGGHTPFIVLDDADAEEAAAAAVRRSFSNMGQICIAVNRVLVAERAAGAFVDALVDHTKSLELGHGVEPGVAYGPVFDEAVRDRVSRHVSDAVSKGGRLLVGGGPPIGEGFERGTFFSPTVLDGVPDTAAVVNEESFGPVAAVQRFGDDAALLAATNRLPYGLAAYVYTRDLERGWAFADRIEAGSVGVNVNDVTELQAPFGGWKLSGIGRELGPEGLHTYLQTRHVRMRVRPLD